MSRVVSLDGELVAAERAAISIFDRGLLYGDGLFEVLPTRGGAPVALAAHLDRLYASARALELAVPAREALTAWIRDAIVAAGVGDHRVRVVVTRGPGALASRLGELRAGGRTIVVVEPLPAQPAELALAIVDWPLPRRAGPTHKTLAYLDHALARELAAAAGADEAIRLHADGRVAECATASLFAVAADTVITPALDGILPGIVRARVLTLCESLAIAAREGSLTVPELRAADEIFVTSALRGVVPVTRLDGVARPVGAVTRRLMTAHAQAAAALI